MGQSQEVLNERLSELKGMQNKRMSRDTCGILYTALEELDPLLCHGTDSDSDSGTVWLPVVCETSFRIIARDWSIIGDLILKLCYLYLF